MSAMTSLMRVLRRGPVIPGPYRQALRHKPSAFGKLTMEMWVSVSRSVPDDLKSLASLRASSLIGCMW